MQTLIDQVDYIMKAAKTKARKAGKHERIAAMVKNLVKVDPAPMVDLLAVGR